MCVSLESLIAGAVLGVGLVLLLWWIGGRAPSFRPANVLAALFYASGVQILQLTNAPAIVAYVLPLAIFCALWLARRRRARAI